MGVGDIQDIQSAAMVELGNINLSRPNKPLKIPEIVQNFWVSIYPIFVSAFFYKQLDYLCVREKFRQKLLCNVKKDA